MTFSLLLSHAFVEKALISEYSDLLEAVGIDLVKKFVGNWPRLSAGQVSPEDDRIRRSQLNKTKKEIKMSEEKKKNLFDKAIDALTDRDEKEAEAKAAAERAAAMKVATEKAAADKAAAAQRMAERGRSR